jgi:hypothetical protein
MKIHLVVLSFLFVWILAIANPILSEEARLQGYPASNGPKSIPIENCIIEKKLPDAMVETTSGAEEIGKVLYVTDSSLALWQRMEIVDGNPAVGYAVTFSYSKIIEIKTKSKGSFLGGLFKGMGLGALIGGGLGALGGFAAGDDPPSSGMFDFSLSAEEKALIGLVAVGASGAVIGGIIGASTKHSHSHWYFVGGNLRAYQEAATSLKRIAVFPDRKTYESFLESHSE